MKTNYEIKLQKSRINADAAFAGLPLPYAESETKLPSTWEACTDAQLIYLKEHGTYGQRKVAVAHLTSRGI